MRWDKTYQNILNQVNKYLVSHVWLLDSKEWAKQELVA